MVKRRPIIVGLLEELGQSWLDLYPLEDIRADVNKLKLLQEARDELVHTGTNPSDTVRGFYIGVFLNEQFSSTTTGEVDREG